MGIIKAVLSSVGGTLADTWLESVVAEDMGETTVMCRGVINRKNDKRNQNKKGSSDVISNGSIIQVEQNQCMIITDGGKIVDFSAEPGYYKVDVSSAPSIFSGKLGAVVKDSFERIKFGGTTPGSQKVYYINLQEIKNIPFGTVNPINYFDEFYNAELYLRTHGYMSVRIADPVKFYSEVVPRNSEHLKITDIDNLFKAEFLTALQSVINKMSADGFRISHVTSRSTELAKYMSDILDEDWIARRGMKIESVGLASISYDESSKKLIDIRNQGAMLSDAKIREGYVQGAAARGIEAAGSNAGGSAGGFIGVGMGMQASDGFLRTASESNRVQIERDRRETEERTQKSLWTCSCGAKNGGKFCSECGKTKPNNERWTCACGNANTGKFCAECGKARPTDGKWICSCGASNSGKFCAECGSKRD